MFSWFKKKDPIQELEKEYLRLMEEARNLQRSGDLVAYAAKVSEADAIMQRIEALRQGK